MRKARARNFEAPVFAALGNETRLRLVSRLSARSPQSISDLCTGAGTTRQAITKHLRVLEDAGLVRSKTQGRETMFVFEPKHLRDLRRYLDFVSRQWDGRLDSLKTFLGE